MCKWSGSSGTPIRKTFGNFFPHYLRLRGPHGSIAPRLVVRFGGDPAVGQPSDDGKVPLAALRSCNNPIGQIAVSLASEVMFAQESNDFIRCTSLRRLGPTTAPRFKGDTVCRGPCVPLVGSDSRAIGSGTASILIDDCSTPGVVLGAFIEKGIFLQGLPRHDEHPCRR